MANWTTLKAAIANVIKTNGNQEITGAVLQSILNSIVNAIGENATYAALQHHQQTLVRLMVMYFT